MNDGTEENFSLITRTGMINSRNMFHVEFNTVFCLLFFTIFMFIAVAERNVTEERYTLRLNN